MARPCVDLINGLAKTLKTSELDKEERESGITAISATFYQMGGMLDARVLLLLWLTSVSMPRSIEYMERINKEREDRKKVAIAVSDWRVWQTGKNSNQRIYNGWYKNLNWRYETYTCFEWRGS
jgi:hypothetical protein